jgi:hypothetical protein
LPAVERLHAPGLNLEMVVEVSTQRVAFRERTTVGKVVKLKQEPCCFESPGGQDEPIGHNSQAPPIDAPGLDSGEAAGGGVEEHFAHGRIKPDLGVTLDRDHVSKKMSDIAPTEGRPLRPSGDHMQATASQ